MEINRFVKKYKLSGEEGVDMWECHNKYILTDDACIKIAHIENIHTDKIECLQSTDGSVRLLVTMKKVNPENGETIKSETTIGEADITNVRQKPAYLGCMAEKRGKDRAILKLVNAYEYGIASEVEADVYKYENKSKSINLKGLEVKLPEIPKDDEATIDDIAKASNGVVVVDDMKVTFGKHKGKMMSKCPLEYLKWLSTAELDFMKDENGKLQTDRVEAHNKCAAYFLATDVEIPF